MTGMSFIVLISGNGSNLQSIIDSIDTGQINASLSAVISNNADAYGLTRANNHGFARFV
jgi:phosphoribosylglycinamide formyltransferase-1